MTLPDENFLKNLSMQFMIAQGIDTSKHIKILKKIENLNETQISLVLNYFLTLETNKEVLAYLVKMVSKYQNELTIDILSDMLVSDDDDDDTSEQNIKLKCEIANTLGRSKNSTCVMPLLYILNNKYENYKLRLACAEALGRIGSSYAVTPLINVVTDNEEKSVYLRESAAKALGMLGDMRAIEPLANVLETRNGLFDKFTFLKERIVETIGALSQNGDEKSIKALKTALQDDAPCVRIGAIEALGEMEDMKVIPIIENMMNDENEDVAKTAVFTLYEILGKDYVKSLLNSRHIQNCCKEEINEILGLEEDNEANINEGK